MAAVEVVVRFAGTLLAARRVRRHERFLIGTAPNVDLPLLGHVAFPLVDRDLAVRVPIGVEADYAFGRTELAFGLVTISLARVDDTPAHLPRPRVQKRIVPFFAAALVMHVALVTVAMATEAPDDLTIPVVRADHSTRVLPKILPAPKPKPKRTAKKAEQAAAAAEPAPAAGATNVAEAREAARNAGVLGSASLDDLSMITGSVNIAEALRDVGPIYDEDAANANNFGGGGGRFDPSKDPAFDSIKTGRYATNGNAGANYRLPPSKSGKFREVTRPPIMGLTCDDGECKTVGTLDRHTIRDYVEKRYVDMVKCFERHAGKTDRIELKLHFEIREDGTANEVHAEESSGFGSCLVRIVERTKFPSDKPTQVTYPVAFWRT